MRVDRLAVPRLEDLLVLVGRSAGLVGAVVVDRPAGLVIRRRCTVRVGGRGGAACEAAAAGGRLERGRLLGVQIRRDAVGLRLQAQLGLGSLVRSGCHGVALDGLGHRIVMRGGARPARSAQGRSLPTAGQVMRATTGAHVHESGGGDDGENDEDENDFHTKVATRMAHRRNPSGRMAAVRERRVPPT